MQELMFKLNKADLNSLGTVRCISGLQVAEEENSIWLRGINETLNNDTRLKQLPIKNTFIVDENNMLFIPGRLTPIDQLKEMEWHSISSFIKVELPVSVLPGKPGEQITIKIISSDSVKEGAALLTSLSDWKNFSETASASRLNRLRFAVSDKEEVMIMGNPLPPLPGMEYWITNDILLPAGFDFEIPLTATFIRERLNKKGDAILVFDVEGGMERIEKTYFVPAKRSAVRLTKTTNWKDGND